MDELLSIATAAQLTAVYISINIFVLKKSYRMRSRERNKAVKTRDEHRLP